MENEKKSYLEKMAEQLVEWDKQIDDLKAKASKAKDDTKGKMSAEFDKNIKEMVEKKEDLKKKIGDVKSSSDDAWAVMKDGLDKASGDLKNSFKAALAKFKNDKD